MASPSTLIAIQGVQFVFVIADEQRRPTAAVVVGGIDAHAAVGRAAEVARRAADRPRSSKRKSRRAAIDVEETIGGVVGDVDVRFAVAVDVHQQHAESLAGVGSAGRNAASPLTSVKVPLPLLRNSLCGRPSKTFGGQMSAGRPQARMIGERPINVVAYVQVGIAVAIEVGPAALLLHEAS